MTEINLPYNLDLTSRPYQAEVLKDSRRFKVLVVPRRHGKTTLAIAKLVMEAIIHPNKVFHYVCPTQRQAKQVVWSAPDMLKQLVPPQAVDRFNEVELICYLKNGSQIHVKGADQPDSGRGSNAFGVVLDEFDQMKAAVFQELYMPIVLANGGWLWVIGTPKGKRGLYEKLAIAKNRPTDWQWLTLKASTAKVLAPEVLELAQAEMTEAAYNQEFECLFLDNAGTLFRRIRENVRGTLCEPVIGRQYIIGVDLAKYEDWTVISILDKTSHEIVYFDRFNKIDWNLQKSKIEAVTRRYNNAKVRIDATGCLTANQRIISERGFVPISDLFIGDKVLTHENRFRKISLIRKKEDLVGVVSILPQYQYLPIEVSFSHLILTKAGWQEASKIKEGDFLKIKTEIKPVKGVVELIQQPKLYHPEQDVFSNPQFYDSELFWRIVGYYLGNGWTRVTKRKTISFAFDLAKTDCKSDLIAFAQMLGRSYYCRDRDGCFEFNINCGWLADWFQRFGKTAPTKKIPYLFDGLEDRLKLEIIRGYWRADGDRNVSSGRNRLRFTSTSLDLLLTVQRWLLHFEIISSLVKSKRDVVKDLSSRPKLTLIVNGFYANKLACLIQQEELPAKKRNPTRAYFEDGFLFTPIKEIEHSDKTTGLYEFEVEEDQSCVANGIIIHNVGDPIYEDLHRTGINIEPFKITTITKKQMVENLVLLLEQDKIKLPDIPELIDELESFSYDLNERTGHVAYSAPAGKHDDIVISLCLAVWQLGEKLYKPEASQKFNYNVTYNKFGTPIIS